MIRFVFTRNNLIGSKSISWGTKEEWQKLEETPSHFSIVLGDYLVIESTLKTGVRLNYLKTFKKKNKIVSSLKPVNSVRAYANKAEKVLERTHGKDYDLLAILYFSYRVILKKLFKLPFPRQNKFNSASKFFCNELYSFIEGRDLSMESPNSLMLRMLESGLFINCEL